MSTDTELSQLNNAIFLDIETAPQDDEDLERYVQVVEAGKWAKYAVELKKAEASGKRKPNRPTMKSESPGLSPFSGRVVAIGMARFVGDPVVFYGQDEMGLLKSLYAAIQARDPGKMLFEQAIESMSRPKVLVTFNGEGFDLPFLAHRAMVQGLPELARILPFSRSRRNGQIIKSVDIYEVMGGKWGINGTLEEYALMYGGHEFLEGTGYEVEGWWKSGEVGKIARHCRGDILAMREVAKRLAPVL
jgi:DNA polymerase elongation subunit (family B)